MIEPAAAAPTFSAVQADVTSLPLAFERNEGQTDAQVDFVARGSGYGLFLASGEAVLDLKGADRGHVVRLKLVDAAADPSAQGEEALASRSNYLVGDQSDWHTDIANFASVRYHDVYDGIDLRYYGNQRQLEYDFLVGAGADANSIRLAFEGVFRTEIAPDGDLLLTLNEQGDQIRFDAPVSYQEGPHGREAVASCYVIHADGTVGFEVGTYDASRNLVIDPVLVYGSFLGGTGVDKAQGIAVDAAGNAYLTGETASAAFPTTAGAYDTAKSTGSDVFVTKLNASGTGLVYSTFIGGSGNDVAWGIALDAAGNAYVTGSTTSSNLPTLNAYQGTLSGAQDAFFLKLNASGSALSYSTYYGGTGNGDIAYGIAVDAAGRAYVAGDTNSGSNIASAGAYDTALSGATDAFLVKFDPTLSGAASRLFGTYLGGTADDHGLAVAVDASGKAYVSGYTNSSNLPTTASAYDAAYNGGDDAFLTVFNAAGNGLTYSTYIGGGGNDSASAIALDAAGKVYLSGSAGSGFITKNAYDATYGGGTWDAIVVKVDPTLSGNASLIYSTYLGGAGTETAPGIAVDSLGRAHVTGYTSGSMPTTADALQSTSAGGTNDAFYATLSSTGNNLVYSTYLGGSGDDVGYAIARDGSDNIYVAGYTASSNFQQTTGGAYDTTQNGSYDAFVVKFSSGTLVVTTTNDVADGATTSIAALLANKGADGLISLREAIIATNNTAGADAISLAAGTYTLSRTGASEDAASTGDLDITGDLTITGAGAASTIVDGNALDRVFHVQSGVNAILTDLTIRGGLTAANGSGGGVYVDSGATLALSRVIITANSAGTGAGLYNFGTLTATDTTFSNNAAVNWGGGLYNDRGVMVLDRVTISGNSAGRDGAGIYNGGSGAALSLVNVTVSGNTAAGDGGGIYTNRSMTITNSTIAFNSSIAGADGIHVQGGGSATLKNTILYNPAGANSNTVLSSADNNLDSDGTAGLAGAGDLRGTVGTPIDPNLGALQYNGGSTKTHALLAGSAAINAGTATGAPTTDQRGGARLGATDIGAYEYTLIGYEPFAYPAGSFNGANGGIGWASGWSSVGSSTTVAASGLQNPADDMPVSGGTAQLTIPLFVGSVVQTRDLSTSLGVAASTTWLSFLIRPASILPGDYVGLQFGSPSATRAFIGTNGSQFVLEQAGGGGRMVVSGITPLVGQTYLLTLKMDFTAGADNMTLYVNPTPGLSGPESAFNVSKNNLDLGTFTRIELAGGQTLPHNASLDEIRIAGSYVDVAPGSQFEPLITSNGGGATAGVNLAENSTAVTTVTATDADLPAQTLSYSISGGVDAAKFTIVAGTGALSFVAAPNYEAPTDAGANNVYDVIVQVSDGALTDTQAIAVTVTDVIEPLQITAAQDTYINSGSASNFGTSTSLVVDRSGANLGNGRALLQFDLSAIPVGATVTGATLQLQATANASPFKIDVYRLTEAWVEGNGGTSAANWNSRLPGTAWTNINGASVDPTPAATWATLPLPGAGTHSWDLTNLVRAWQTGAAANYGILLGSAELGATTVTYNSSEGVTPPRLVVSYTLDVAPTAINLSAAETYTEDTALNLTDVVVSDIDSASVTATLTLSNAAAGSLNTGTSGTVTSTFSAGVWRASGAIANVNSLLAGLTFTPALNFNSNFSIATSVNDGVAAPVTGSKAMTGTGVNDAPLLTGASNLNTINEDPASNSGTLVSALISGKLSDADAGALSGIAVTAVNNANGNWQYTTNGGAAWNAFGTLDAGTARLLAADANTSVRFVPNPNWNGTLAGGLTFRAWDQTSGVAGGAADTTLNGGTSAFSTATASASITVTSVNDAPAGTNNTVTTNEDTAYTFSAADFGFSDPNDTPANTLNAVRISTLPGAGTLTNNGVAVSPGQTIVVADINAGRLKFNPAADANGAGYASFAFQVQDGGGTANGGIDVNATPNTLTVNVTAVNDAPSGTNNTITTSEDTAYTFGAADFGFTDPNDSPANALTAVRISTVPGAGTLRNNGAAVSTGETITLTDINAGRLVFTPATNASGTGYASFTFQVQDGGGTINGGINLDVTPNTLTVNVTAVNDAPLLTGANNLNTINEDPASNSGTLISALIFGKLSDADADAGALSGIAVTAVDNANGTWQYTTNGGAAWNAFGTLDAGTARLLAADANTSVRFVPNPNWNGTLADGLTFRAWDQTSGVAGGTADTALNGGTSAFSAATASAGITVIAVNDAPAGTNNTVSTNEDTAYTFSAADFGFSDPNDSPVNNLDAVRISTLPGAGTLSNNGAAVSVGQTIVLADINAGKLKYTPAANASGTGYASFTFRVRDNGGTANGGVNLDPTPNTLTVNVSAVNDAPVNTVPAAQATAYNTPLVFSTPNGNRIALADADAGSASIQVALGATNGTLALSGVAGLTFTSGGNGAAAMTFTGSLADINTALDGLRFTPTTNFSGAATISVQSNDLGNTGSGGARSDSDAVALTVNAPTALIIVGDSFATPGAAILSAPSVLGNDSDPAMGTLSVTAVNGSAAAVGNTVTLASGARLTMNANGSFAYDPNGAFDALPLGATAVNGFTYGVASTAGGTGSGTVAITVNGVNDAPVLSGANDLVTVSEDALGNDGTLVSALIDGWVADADSAALSGIAVTAVDNANGSWQYTTDGGGTWLAFGTPSTGSALLLAADAGTSVRFVSNADWNGSVAGGLRFKAWDQTSGVAGATADATAGGSSSAFSLASFNASITVDAVNDAPAGTNNTVSTIEDTAYTFSAADFGFSDAADSPAHTFAALRIGTLPSAGTLTNDGAALSVGQSVSVADINAGRLVFAPAADASGTGYASFTFQVQDDGGTANGGIDLDASPHTLTVNVSAVNDAPAGADNTVTTTEDTAYIFSAADFGFSDAADSPANNFSVVRIGTLPAAGTLTNNGAAFSSGQSVSVADIAAGRLVFTPAADATGTGYASFSFQVQDDGGTANGGIDLDASPHTMAVNITAQNDAPVLTGANNLNAINEDPASNNGTLVSALIASWAADVDTAALSGIAVTAVNNTNGSWRYTTNGGAAWTPFGTPTASSAVLLAADAATSVRFVPNPDWNGSVAGGITFRAWDRSSGTAGSTADTSVNGGTSAFSAATASAGITVVAVNDAPAGTDRTVSTNEDTAYTFSAADFGFSDVADSPPHNFSAVRIGTLPAAGTLSNNGAAVSSGQSVSVADINAGRLVFTPAADASGTGYASFSFQVQDDGGTANGGIDLDASPHTLTVNVSAVNDAPAGADNTVTTTEDTAYVFSAADFGFSDAADSPANNFSVVRIGTLPAAGTLTNNGAAVSSGQSVSVADINAGRLVFAPAADASGTGYASFTFQVQDDGGSANGGTDLDASPNTLTVNVSAVNDAPAGTDSTVTAIEDTAYIFSAADFGFSDAADSPTNAFSAVRIDTLPGAGTLSVNGAALSAGQSVSVADLNAGRLVFTPAADATGTGYASFSFQVQDDGGTANGGIDLDASPNTLTVNVTAVNDAPLLGGANNLNVIGEDPASDDGTLVAALIAGQVSDADSAALSGIAVTAVNNANGTWQYTTDGGAAWNAFGTLDVGTARLLAADANTSVRFVPNANWNGTLAGGLTFRAWDQTSGTAGSTADTTSNGGTSAFSAGVTSAGITVTSVNGAPAGADNTVTTFEDTAYTFAAADFGFTDPNDSPANALTAVLISTLPGAGTLTNNGAAVSAGQTVTVADIIAGRLAFTPAADANGTGYASFTFQVQDGGGTANGGIDVNATPNTLTVNVTAVNDAAVIGGVTSGVVSEDGVLAASGTLTISDPDAGQARFVAQSGAASANGYGSLSIAANGDWSYALDNARAAVQALGGGQSMTDSFVVTSADGSTQVVSITIAGANDLPSADSANASGFEDRTLAITLGGADIDGAIASFRLLALPTAGGKLYLDADASLPAAAGVPYSATNNALTLYFRPSTGLERQRSTPVRSDRWRGRGQRACHGRSESCADCGCATVAGTGWCPDLSAEHGARSRRHRRRGPGQRKRGGNAYLVRPGRRHAEHRGFRRGDVELRRRHRHLVCQRSGRGCEFTAGCDHVRPEPRLQRRRDAHGTRQRRRIASDDRN